MDVPDVENALVFAFLFDLWVMALPRIQNVVYISFSYSRPDRRVARRLVSAPP